jgi:hypothetical protein
MTLIVVLAASCGASAAQLRNRNFPHGLSNRKSFATTLPLSRKTSANLPKLLVTARNQDVWAALVEMRLAAIVVRGVVSLLLDSIDTMTRLANTEHGSQCSPQSRQLGVLKMSRENSAWPREQLGWQQRNGAGHHAVGEIGTSGAFGLSFDVRVLQSSIPLVRVGERRWFVVLNCKPLNKLRFETSV